MISDIFFLSLVNAREYDRMALEWNRVVPQPFFVYVLNQIFKHKFSGVRISNIIYIKSIFAIPLRLLIYILDNTFEGIVLIGWSNWTSWHTYKGSIALLIERIERGWLPLRKMSTLHNACCIDSFISCHI